MKNCKYQNLRPYFLKQVRRWLSGQSGNVIAYIAMLLIIFGVIGAIMATLLTSSVTSTATPNHSRRALYMTEAGMRYGLSQLRNNEFAPSVIDDLNNTTYTLSAEETFTLNIFGPWFDSASDQSFSAGGNLTLNVPEGERPQDFKINFPADIWVVNYDYIGDSLSTSTSVRDPITSFSGTNPLTIGLTADFIVGKHERVCLAVKPAFTQTVLNDGGDLYVDSDAKNIFPQHHGAININRIDYVYESLIDDVGNPDRAILTNLSAPMPNTLTPFPFSVDYNTDSPYTGDFVILSPRNHIIIPTGTSETVSAGGTLDEAVSAYDQYTVKFGTRKPDIDAEDLTSNLSQKETDTSFVGVDTAADTLNIGGGVTGGTDAEFGAAWYDANKVIGGDLDFCQAGKCKFGLGTRAFFTLQYWGGGDGLTFTLINGQDNGATSVGGDIELSELLGYAGDSRLNAAGTSFLDGLNPGEGLKPPKIALEFDTRTNNDTLVFCANATNLNPNTRNDPLSNDKDAVQYVFWGKNDLTGELACRNDDPSYDDNQHNAGESNENWTFLTGGDVNSSAAFGDDGTIYVGSNNGNVYAINPDGTPKGLNWPFATGGAVISSPAVGADGTIYVGSNDGNVYAINADGSQRWSFSTGWAVRSSPAIGADGTVYIGSDDHKVYAFTPAGTKRWEYQTGGDISLGRPAIGPSGTIYVAADDAKIYALDPDDRLAGLPFPTPSEWTFDLGDNNDYAPGVDPNTGTIYTDELGSELRAINPDGTSKWVKFVGSDIDSTPAVGADGTIYFGTDSQQSLFALEPVNGNVIWQFITGGEVDTSPAIDSEGTIYIVSNDDNLYAVNPDGTEKWRFPILAADGDVNSSPTFDPNTGIVYVGSDDNNLYAINRFALPRNLRNNLVTTTGSGINAKVGGESVQVEDEDDWLAGGNTKGPWAIRLEVMRSLSTNANGNYEYTLHTWIRQCAAEPAGSNCTDENIIGTLFQDTRIEYNARDPHLSQTVELSPADQAKFDRLLFGFTGATGAGTSQNAIIGKFQLSFIRPGDPVIGPGDDPNWPPP